MARQGLAHALRAGIALAVAAIVLTVAAPADARYAQRTLKLGSQGGDVKRLQTYLTRAGFRASPDGHFGRRTRVAQRRFERRARLRVNGRASRAEQRRVRRMARRRAASQPGSATGGTTHETSVGNPGDRAVIGPDGRTAIAPDSAPQPVKDAIAAANRITRKPYRYGGGHGSWEDSGYDCSGAVSYALHGGDLLDRPLASGGFMRWGAKGRGDWITVYANSGHAYVVIAGLRFDTSAAGADGGRGPRWRDKARSARDYVARHPAGL
jgi:peptidoglycan hydrolase-like protein with peptidoglycan-binding domain